MYPDFKFPKLSSDSPVNRIKSRTPVRLINKSVNLQNLSSKKLLNQKEQMLRINESLASKYFLPEPIHSSTPTPVSVSPISSNRSDLNKKLWNRELDKINSKFIKNELKLLQTKDKNKKLSDLQQEFFLYKDYIDQLSGLYSNFCKDLGFCVKKGVLGLAQVFSKVFRKCMESESDKVIGPSFEGIELKNVKKDLRNLCVQTDEATYDISEDELENLRTLKDRMKTVKISQIVDKLLELKQSMVDMYTFLPNPTEHPEMSPDSYNFLLKLINSYSKSSEKIDNFTQTTRNESKIKEKLVKSLTVDQETQIYKDIEKKGISELSEVNQYKGKIFELNKALKDCEDKIIWLESQKLLGLEIKKKKRIHKQTQATWEPDQDLIKESKKEILDLVSKLNEIELEWEKMTGYKFQFGGNNPDRVGKELKIGIEMNLGVKKQESFKEKEKNIRLDRDDFSKYQEKPNNAGIMKGNYSKFCSNCKNFINLNNSLAAKGFNQGFLEDKLQEKVKNLKKNSKSCQFSFGESEKIEVQQTETGIKVGIHKKKDQKIDKSLEELLKIFSGAEGTDAISGIFEESELALFSKKFRIQLIEIFKDHLNKKCIGVCQHLKRAMNLKRKVNGVLYPIKKIII